MGRIAVATVLAFGGLGLLGCDEPAPGLREWRPDDHQQPEGPDPDRSPGGETASPEPSAPAEPPSPEAIARAAAAVYRSSCASCHGMDGRGGGPQAPAGATMPDLTAAAYHESHTDAQIGAVISSGRGAMPAFEWLNANGIAALVGHVRSYDPRSAAEPTEAAAAPSEPAPSEPAPSEPAPSEAEESP